jgi:hypothetical protein
MLSVLSYPASTIVATVAFTRLRRRELRGRTAARAHFGSLRVQGNPQTGFMFVSRKYVGDRRAVDFESLLKWQIKPMLEENKLARLACLSARSCD